LEEYWTAIISLFLLISISPNDDALCACSSLLFSAWFLESFWERSDQSLGKEVNQRSVSGRLNEKLRRNSSGLKGFNAEAQEIKTFAKGVMSFFPNVKQA